MLCLIKYTSNKHIVMVRMLASSVVYGGFKPLSGQTKSVKLVLDASLLSTNINGERTKTGWLGIRILCTSELLFQ